MNHQPFRDWLLSEEKLSADQTHALQNHLDSCESCSQIETAWLEVESAFQKVPQIQPEPGFTTRWQTNLAEYQYKTQKRRGWLSIGLTVLIVTSLLGVIVTQLWSLLQAPGQYLMAWFNGLIDLVAIYYTLQNLFSSFTGEIPVYTFIGIFFLIGFISFMSVLWLSVYRKLILARRLV